LSDEQTKQLLLRKMRNEWSAAQHWSARRKPSARQSLDRIKRA
jgi:hypothetical protein